jgi:hypothetical protein
MPRLKTREVLALAIRAGAASKDFFGTAYGEADSKFEGFSFGGGNVVFDDTLLLIEPQAAQVYEHANQPKAAPAPAAAVNAARLAEASTTFSPTGTSLAPESGSVIILAPGTPAAKPKTFYGTADVPAATAKMLLVQIADEIVSVLTSDPNATVRLVVEISAGFPDGAGDGVRRAVSENARSLAFRADWE